MGRKGEIPSGVDGRKSTFRVIAERFKANQERTVDRIIRRYPGLKEFAVGIGTPQEAGQK